MPRTFEEMGKEESSRVTRRKTRTTVDGVINVLETPTKGGSYTPTGNEEMGKGESPRVTRRNARSTVDEVINVLVTPKKGGSYTPTVNEEMGKEESPQVTRRNTRCIGVGVSNVAVTPKKAGSYTPTVSEEMSNDERSRVNKRNTRSTVAGVSNVVETPKEGGSHTPTVNEEVDKEESSQVTRIVTRSTAAGVNNVVETTKKCDPCTPTVNDLGFREEPISSDDLLSHFPGRRTQILEIVRHLGSLNSPMFPLFMYGGASTGKTSITLQTFRHLNRPFIYSSCRTCYSPRILFESILNQLLLHTKRSENGYSSVKRCEKPSDFVNFLREALANVTDKLKGNLGKQKKSVRQVNGTMIYLIFDNLELVRGWDKSSTMIHFLFNLYDILKTPEVGLIFISNASIDTFYTNTGFFEPVPIHFPNYTEDDLRQIFLRNEANRKLYSSFLDVVLKPFCRITRRVDELSTAFSPLFKIYCEPLSELGIAPNEDMKRRLFSHIQPHIAPSLNEIFRVPSKPSSEVKDSKEIKRKASKKSEASEDFGILDFHMSTSAKYLLISAFLASRNPATLDASMFDPTGGSDNRKRKRKPSEKSKDKKETAEEELMMKGPGTFPLERLLAIFQCITSVAGLSLDDAEVEKEGLSVEDGNGGLMSDVLLQLSSLCNANFIVKGGSCPLEGSTRYRSTISEDMALKVARSVKLPLSKYLYRR